MSPNSLFQNILRASPYIRGFCEELKRSKSLKCREFNILPISTRKFRSQPRLGGELVAFSEKNPELFAESEIPLFF
jgi:hypothetical protein